MRGHTETSSTYLKETLNLSTLSPFNILSHKSPNPQSSHPIHHLHSTSSPYLQSFEVSSQESSYSSIHEYFVSLGGSVGLQQGLLFLRRNFHRCSTQLPRGPDSTPVSLGSITMTGNPHPTPLAGDSTRPSRRQCTTNQTV